MRRNEVPIKSLPHSRHRNFKLKAAFGAERWKAVCPRLLRSRSRARSRASVGGGQAWFWTGFHRRSWRSCAPRDTQPSTGAELESRRSVLLAIDVERETRRSCCRNRRRVGLLTLRLGRGGGAPIGRTPRSRRSRKGTYCEQRTDRVHCAADAPKITGHSLVNRLSIPRIPAIRSANVCHRPAYRRRFLHG